jgi:hypothetical protein
MIFWPASLKSFKFTENDTLQLKFGCIKQHFVVNRKIQKAVVATFPEQLAYDILASMLKDL